MDKKMVRVKADMLIFLTEEEFDSIYKEGAAGRAILREKLNDRSFILEGPSIVQSNVPCLDNEWPVETDIYFTY